METIALAASGSPVESADLDRRARLVGRIVAELGCDLLTGSGFGATEIVARSFCEKMGRSWRSVGVIPEGGNGFCWRDGRNDHEIHRFNGRSSSACEK